MPFDDSEFLKTVPDLSAPSLEGLSFLLRHRDRWPEDHRWAFQYGLLMKDSETVGCALGIAQLIWGLPICAMKSHHVAALFGMEDEDFGRIFHSEGRSYGYAPLQPADVTPEQVADAIDRYLANRPDA